MTCHLFNTDPDLVTPLGIWLARKLNRLADIVWPFVTQRSYDRLRDSLAESERARRELTEELEEFADWHYSNNDYLPVPDLKVKFNVDDIDSHIKRFNLELEPVCKRYDLNVWKRRNSELLTENIITLLIRLTRDEWADKAEHQLRRYFKEIYSG